MRGHGLAAQAAQAELQGYQLDKFRSDAEKDKVIQSARDATSKWLKGRIKTGEEGAVTDFSNEDFALGSKLYAMHLAEGGQYDEALKAANEGMGYAVKKIQAETAERADAVTKAAALARNGSYDAAIDVSKRFIPDGSTPTKVTEGKDGRITVERTSTLDGAALKPVIYKNRDELATSLLSIADPKEASDYIDRTFRHDIMTRQLGMEGSRLGLAKDAETRAKGKDEREQKRQDAADQALADMDVAEQSGDKAAYNNARLRAIRNGVKLDKVDDKPAHIPLKNRRGETEGVMVFKGGQPSGYYTSADAVAATPGQGGGLVQPPQAALDALRKNPDLAAQFDAKYGEGASRRILGRNAAGAIR